MVCTTFLDTKEKSIVTNKELSNLLNRSEVTKNRFVVKERVSYSYKRYFLIFEIEQREVIYDIYYRYDGLDSTSVQHVTLPSNTTEGVLNYFYGILEGLKTNAIQN